MKDEKVDILDEDGNKTGRVLMKSETHTKGLWHGSIHLWIYNSKGQVLLQLRHPDRIIRPNVWDISVAGHISAGMEPKETVIIEAKEELSLKINSKELVFVGNIQTQDPMPAGWVHRTYNWVYLLPRDIDLGTLKLEEEETSDVRWIDIGQLDRELDDFQKGELYSQSIKHIYKYGIEQIRKAVKNKK